MSSWNWIVTIVKYCKKLFLQYMPRSFKSSTSRRNLVQQADCALLRIAPFTTFVEEPLVSAVPVQACQETELVGYLSLALC